MENSARRKKENNNNNSSPSNRFKNKKKSFFHFLTKKSTKIEPSRQNVQLNDGDDEDDEEDCILHRNNTKVAFEVGNGENNVRKEIKSYNQNDLNRIDVHHENNGISRNGESHLSTIKEYHDQLHPKESEYGVSIAMQACKSRLREKLLPPGTKEINQRPRSAEYGYEELVSYESTESRWAMLKLLFNFFFFRNKIYIYFPGQ